MARPLRLLTIGPSYVVGLNRALPHEMAVVGQGRWEVTAIAPKFYWPRSALRPIHFEAVPGEACRTLTARTHLGWSVHLFFYERRLRGLLQKPWDLIHCWQEPYVLASAQVTWLSPKQLPLVFWTAQNLPKRYPPPFCWVERFCLDRCTGWEACGQTTVEALLPRGYSVKPYRKIPLGVAMNTFCLDLAAKTEVRRELGWNQAGPPVVGFLGRFVEQKGLLLLTRVLDKLHTPWRALLVGSGPLEPQARAWAERHGRLARVVTGVRHEAVPRYLNAMDILAVPSQTMPKSREQLGRVIVEAWACRVPVVGSSSGEIPHVMADVGVVVSEKDTQAWAQQLASLMESPARRSDLAARGFARATETYAWQVIARQHLAFFEELL